jgi:transposase-like protein
MDDLSRFCCQNPDCSEYGIRGQSNLSVCDRYGKHKQYRLLYCNVCKARFSERKGTPFFQARLPMEKVLSVLEHLAEGCGVRKTERLVGVHRDTVTRLSRLAGEHASEAHDEFVAFSPENQRGSVR